MQEAWRLFHQGKFAEAVALGLEAGGGGITAANKAQAIYANGVEPKDAAKIALFEEMMKRAEAQARAQGFGGKIRAALGNALKIQARHADAHIAMGAYHAEIMDKVGALVGGLTHGASKDKGEEHYRKALKLAPDSPIAHIEMANGLVLMQARRCWRRPESPTRRPPGWSRATPWRSWMWKPRARNSSENLLRR